MKTQLHKTTTNVLLFCFFLLLANAGWCDNLSVNIPLLPGHQNYSICNSSDHQIGCQFTFSSAMVNDTIYIPLGACILDSTHVTNPMFIPIDTTPSFYIYKVSASISPLKFFVDLTAISCAEFFGSENQDAIIAVHHTVTGNTSSFSQPVNLNKPSFTFTSLSDAVDCIKGHEYSRTYEIKAFAAADYDSFIDSALIESELDVREVIIKKFDSVNSIVGDSIIVHLDTIDCTKLPGDPQVTESPDSVLSHSFQPYQLHFAKGTGLPPGTIQLPDSFKTGWSVQITERFTCISMSSNYISRYIIHPNPCEGDSSPCGTVADLPCDITLTGTLDASCTPVIYSNNANGLSFSVGDSVHGFIDVYNTSAHEFQYIIKNLNWHDSFKNLKGAKRFYGVQLIIDTTYFSIPSVNDIIVKTRDSLGTIYSLTTSPVITMSHDTVRICFKNTIGDDPDGAGPFTNVFPDPANTDQYYCDLPGGSSLIIQLSNINFAASDSLIHNCNYHFIDFLKDVKYDAPTMQEIDLCLQTDRQFHYPFSGGCTNVYHRIGAKLSGEEVPFYTTSFMGNENSYSSVSDLAIAPSTSSQTNIARLTYSFHQTDGISPWDLSLNNSGYHAVASHYGETYYAHVSIPPGYLIVSDSGYTYSATRYGNPNAVFYYDTLLTQDSSVCREYDLVLPGVSCSISFRVKLVVCSPDNDPGCLSQNHPLAFNDDSTVNSGITDFRMQFRSQLNDSIHAFDTTHVHTSLKYLVYACEEIPLYLHCYGECNGFPASTTDFTFERNTFGWQNDAAFLAGTGHFTSSQSEEGKQRVYIKDDIFSTASGSIAAPISSCYTNLNFEISYPSPDTLNPVFAFDSCHITFTITSGSHPGVYTYYLSNPPFTFSLDTLRAVQTLHFDMTQFPVASGVTINSLMHDADTARNTISFTGHYHLACVSFLDPGHYMLHRVQAQFTISGDTCQPLLSCDPWGAPMDVLVIRNNILSSSVIMGQGFGFYHRAELDILPEGGYPHEVDFPGEYRPLIEYPSDFSFAMSGSLFLTEAFLLSGTDNITYQLYNISGLQCSDTSNPTASGHCPGAIQGGPFNPGDTVAFHLDTTIHKFSMNGDTVTALPIPTLAYKLQSKDVSNRLVFDVTRTCLPADSSPDWVANFNFPFQSFSSYNSYQHHFPDTTLISCNIADITSGMDTLLRNTFTAVNFDTLYDADTLEPIAINPDNTYFTLGDTLVFCADHFSYAQGRATWIYSPDPTLEIVSIEEGVTNCSNTTTTFQHLDRNDAGNLFYLNCPQQSGHLRFKIKFNCIQTPTGNYSPSPITLNYGEFTNRCLLQTLNPDSTSDTLLLASCGIFKNILIYAQPEHFLFTFTVGADSDAVGFCENDTIRIHYQLVSGAVYNSQLQIVNTDFDSTQAVFTLTEGSDTIHGGFNGTGDTLTFPVSIADTAGHDLNFVYFPGCSYYNNIEQVFHFTMHGINACGDPVISGNKDTANVHIVYQNFITSSPFHSLKLKGDSVAGCTTTLHDTIRVTYSSFHGSIQFHLISPWLDSIWTSNSPDTILSVPLSVHVTNNTCSSTYDLSVTVNILDSCSSGHACPLDTHVVNKSIHVTCVNCCTNADSTYINGSVSPTPGVSYNINQNITISGNITFSTNEMFIAPNVTISLAAGATLHITDSSYLHACHDMWHGISVIGGGGGGGITIDSGSIVEDADTALYLETMIPVYLSHCLFTNNYMDVFINPSSITDGNVTFNGVTFNGSTSLTKAPHLGQKSFVNVKLNRMLSLDIGDNSYEPNTFQNSTCGIIAYRSNFSVIHNVFENIVASCPSYSPCQLDGIAIYSQASTYDSLSLLTTDCSFTKCGSAVTTRGKIGSLIYNNAMDTMGLNAIYIINPDSVEVNIHNNSISHYFNGVVMYEPRKTKLTRIYENTFNSIYDPDSTSTPPTAAVYWSVKLQNILSGVTRAVISTNQMENQFKGIYCINADSVRIDSNFIQLQGGSVKRYGIWIVNGDHNTIEADTVQAFSGSNNLLVRGIRFESSTYSSIENNYLLNLGTGINGLSYCENTKIACNRIVNGVRGMMFENISLSPQGDENMPQDNKWDNIALTTRCNGTGLLTDWYHRGAQSDVDNQFSPGTNNSNFLASIPNQTGNSLCDDLDTMPLMFTHEQLAIILNNDSMVYPVYDKENKVYAEEYMYRLISSDSSIMDRGYPDSVQIEQFMSNLQRSNLVLFKDIEAYIGSEDFNTAYDSLFEITDSTHIEHNLKIIEEYLIYLLGNEEYKLSGTDSLVLDSIANELAIEGGRGVYYARAILDRELDDNITAPLFRIKTETKKLIESELYPNPNNGSFTYEYIVSDSGDYQIEIVNVNSVVQKIINVNGEIGRKEISFLHNGIYFLLLKNENEIIDWKKIIVVR